MKLMSANSKKKQANCKKVLILSGKNVTMCTSRNYLTNCGRFSLIQASRTFGNILKFGTLVFMTFVSSFFILEKRTGAAQIFDISGFSG